MHISTKLCLLFFVKPAEWMRHLLPGLVWKIPTGEKVLYLTFDDGPVPGLTGWILDELEKFGAKATFFCVGENVVKYPELYSKMLEAGHCTGNHTYSHLNSFRNGIRHYVKDTDRAAGVIDSRLLRPPHGRIRLRAARILRLRYRIILWDVLSMDYDMSLKPETVLDNVLKNAEPGSIVCFHDNLKARVNLEYVLPEILSHYSRAGYRFLALDENLLK